MEFMDEVNVVTGGYMPEYGRSTGGIISAVTRSAATSSTGPSSELEPGAAWPGAATRHAPPGVRPDRARWGTSETSARTLGRLSPQGPAVVLRRHPVGRRQRYVYSALQPSHRRRVRALPGRPGHTNGSSEHPPYIGKLTYLFSSGPPPEPLVTGMLPHGGGEGGVSLRVRPTADGSAPQATVTGVFDGAQRPPDHIRRAGRGRAS